MARFYFDVDDGRPLSDEVGRMLEPSELRREALKVVTALAAAEAEDMRETALILTVRDEAGRIPFKIRLACQVED